MQEKILSYKKSPYQKMLFMQEEDGTYSLYLDGFWQFNTGDEHLYHELLTGPAMLLAPKVNRVLIMGGGDGLGVKQILKYPEVKEVTLVDLDPAVTNLAQTHPIMRRINHDALNHPKTKIINADARRFLRGNKNKYDVVIADFPSPNFRELLPLYSRDFYGTVKNQLNPLGVFATHIGTDNFKTIHKRIAGVWNNTVPMMVYLSNLNYCDYVVGTDGNARFKRGIPRGSQWLSYMNIMNSVIK